MANEDQKCNNNDSGLTEPDGIKDIQRKGTDYIQDFTKTLRAGDKILFPRKKRWCRYDHYGIFVGKEHEDKANIVHLTPEKGIGAFYHVLGFLYSTKYLVQENSISEVAKGNEWPKKRNNLDIHLRHRLFSPDKIVERARSKLGRRGYSLLFYNCEHFANLMRYNKWISEQVLSFGILLPVIVFMLASISGLIGWLPKDCRIEFLLVGLILSSLGYLKMSSILSLYTIFDGLNNVIRIFVVVVITLILIYFPSVAF